ncbi:hypothetical protein GCM10027405_20730 [Arthrobacter alkaliphilus]
MIAPMGTPRAIESISSIWSLDAHTGRRWYSGETIKVPDDRACSNAETCHASTLISLAPIVTAATLHIVDISLHQQ